MPGKARECSGSSFHSTGHGDLSKWSSISNNLFHYLSIRYFDFETTDYKKAASCSGDLIHPTAGSDRTFCVGIGAFEQGDCNIPAVSSEQITPIAENGRNLLHRLQQRYTQIRRSWFSKTSQHHGACRPIADWAGSHILSRSHHLSRQQQICPTTSSLLA